MIKKIISRRKLTRAEKKNLALVRLAKKSDTEIRPVIAGVRWLSLGQP